MSLRNHIVAFSSLLTLTACFDECRKYSDFTCDEIQKAEYNVYFYYPSGTEEFLGKTKTLGSCQYMSRGFAADKGVSNENWSYVCCMIAKDSSCYEKHK